MPNFPINQGGSRFAELDGLRALAVVSVILYHCEISGAFSAGFFGVDMFFTISGFIITAILLKKHRETGGFGFGGFYFRRAKRLLPPVLGLIAIALLATPWISESAYAQLKADMPAALIYFSNWWQIGARQSYFDTTPHVLKHLWSLAVEEQFYILWPPVAYGLLKKFRPRTTGTLSLVFALASAVWMGYLYELNIDGADQNRIYLGSDTHAMGLLTGAALACFWNPWAQNTVSTAARGAWRYAAVLSLAMLCYMIEAMNISNPSMYHGSFLLVPLLTCALAYCTMNDPAFFLSRILRTRIIQWIGLRSYSLYLVHWLVFVWMRLLGWNDFSNWTVLVAALAAVVLLAELMYRCIESPSIRYNPGNLKGWPAFSMAAYTCAAVTYFVTMVALPDVRDAGGQAAGYGPAAVAGVADPDPFAAAPPEDDTADLPDKMIDPGQIISGGEDIYAIGDSVLLGASRYLLKTIPGIRIDAVVGRQASQGLKVVKDWQGKTGKASTVLVHLGTNGYINEGQFRALLRELADRKSVIVVNVHAERRWTAPNNEIIGRIAREFQNVRQIDWHSVSARRPEYFVKDGIHLTRKGILALSAEIKVATGGSVMAGTDIVMADAGHPQARKGPAAEARGRSAPGAKADAPGEGAQEAPENAAQPAPATPEMPQSE